MSRFGLKTVIDFPHFGLESVMAFEKTTGEYMDVFVVSTTLIRKKDNMQIRNGFLWEIFFLAFL